MQGTQTDRNDEGPGHRPDPAPDAQAARLRHRTAAALFAAVPQIAEDMTARPDDPDEALADFVARLAESPIPEEAVTAASYGLAPRYAVWWAHGCLEAEAGALGPADLRLMALCADWAYRPDDDRRLRALDAAMTAPQATPGVWLGFAAGWSSGSMVPPEQAFIPVQPFMCGRAVNAAVLTALARVARPRRRAALSRCIAEAVALMQG